MPFTPLEWRMLIDSQEQTLFDALSEQNINLPAPDWPKLGEGVWGCVYDLGDGTLLKTIRKQGGLGSGLSKWARERHVLEKLSALPVKGFDIPDFLGAGELSLGATAWSAPLQGWIRMSNLGAKTLHREQSVRGGRQQLGEEIGACLAHFHSLRIPSDSSLRTLKNPLLRTLDELEGRLGRPDEGRLIQSLRSEIERQCQDIELVLTHGDIHTENICRRDTGELGLFDWAECGMGPRETDLKHFELFPDLRDAVVLGYQIASGTKINWDLYYLAATVNALTGMALHAGGTIRDEQRVRGLVDHCAQQAGISL